jgi:succinoglycan biosynthesis transport protein ExoP
MDDRRSVSQSSGSDFEERQLNLREYFLVVVKRRWMIFTIALFIVTVVAVYSFLKTPLYRAGVTMYINRINYNIVPEVVTDTSSWMGYEAFFQTEYKLLKSKTLARRVVDRIGLKPSDLLPPRERKNVASPSDPAKIQAEKNDTANALLGMVEINPLKNTFLCEISFTTVDPKLTMILANAWADEYINFSLQSQYEYTQTAEDLITGQVKALQLEIIGKEKLLQDYSLEKRVVKLDNDRSMSSHTLEDLNSAITLAVQERIAKEVHYRDVESQSKEAVPQVSSSTVVQQLKAEHASLERQYTEKSKLYKEDYPEMIRLKSQMDQIQTRIDQEADEIFRNVLAVVHSDYLEALNKENALEKQMEDFKKRSIEINRREFDYDRLKLELDNKRQLLDTLLKKQSETGVSVQVKERKATTIRIIDRAEMPSSIYSPNIKRNILFALMIGMVIAIAFAFVLEYFDSSLKSAEDVERHVQLPFLGIIPRYVISENSGNGGNSRALVKQEDTDQSLSEATDLLTLYNPNSVASEAFKSIRTSLLLSFPEAPPHTILVTSSRPGEGKTFVACNLAVSLAQLDKRVVLIDADMRNPRVHRIWSLRNDEGLSRFLTSDIQANTIIRASQIQGLSLITSGAKTPRPAELLSSSRLDQLLQELEGHFDHVVIDSPPVMPVADSLILAAKSKSVVFVIHGGVTPRDVVQMAKYKLSKSDAVMAGAVLNHIDLNDPYYYYSYYSDYAYRYGQQPKNPPKFLQ